MRTRCLVLAGAALIQAAACRTSTGLTRPLPPDRATVLTAAEIGRSDAATAYEAVERLRPLFFATRGATSFLAEPRDAIVIVMNRMVLYGVYELRNIRASSVSSIRRLSPAEVYQQTGRSAPSGGLEVIVQPR